MPSITGQITHFANPAAASSNQYSHVQRDILSVDKAQKAITEIKNWPHYAPTPLHSLDTIAADSKFAKIWYKDESHRFGLKSFKALGGAYAVLCQLQKVIKLALNKEANIEDLLSHKYQDALANTVISCATDGNHGRSVAWGAQLFGVPCIIYIHKDVSVGREQAMQAYGAQVIRITGNYDASVRQAAVDAKEFGRLIVSDTSYEGYLEVPKDVALGYTVMLAEVVDQLAGEIPSHIFIQGGVGGLASAVTGYFWDLWEDKRPRLIVVEPIEANCLQRSAMAGKVQHVEGDLETLMAGLACGEVSVLAWEILANGADDFMTLSEEAVAPTMRLLAIGNAEEDKIEAGESAVAGLAAAIIASKDTHYRTALGLDEQSTVLVFGTEGATDPELYQQLTNG